MPLIWSNSRIGILLYINFCKKNLPKFDFLFIMRSYQFVFFSGWICFFFCSKIECGMQYLTLEFNFSGNTAYNMQWLSNKYVFSLTVSFPECVQWQYPHQLVAIISFILMKKKIVFSGNKTISVSSLPTQASLLLTT